MLVPLSKWTLVFFLGLLAQISAVDQVWFNENVVTVPLGSKKHESITCHANNCDAPSEHCSFVWKKGGIRIQYRHEWSKSSVYELIDRNRTLVIKAPMKEEYSLSPYTCIVKKKDGDLLGEANMVLKVISVKKTNTGTNAGQTKAIFGNVRMEHFKDPKNIALYWVMGSLLVAMTIIWSFILHCCLRSVKQGNDVEQSLEQQIQKVTRGMPPLSKQGSMVKRPAGAVPLPKIYFKRASISDSEDEPETDSDSETEESEEENESPSQKIKEETKTLSPQTQNAKKASAVRSNVTSVKKIGQKGPQRPFVIKQDQSSGERQPRTEKHGKQATTGFIQKQSSAVKNSNASRPSNDMQRQPNTKATGIAQKSTNNTGQNANVRKVPRQGNTISKPPQQQGRRMGPSKN